MTVLTSDLKPVMTWGEAQQGGEPLILSTHLPAPQRARPWERILVCILLLIHAFLLVWSARLHSPTADEPVHLTAGLRRLREGKFDLNRGNPPLADLVCALPTAFMAPRMDWSKAPNSRVVARSFFRLNSEKVLSYVTAGRWACMPISILGGLVCYLWARELYGVVPGLMALTMWCTCPNILAHGQLMTGDLSATAFGVLAFFAFWKWLRRPTGRLAVLAGIALGLAELSKFVWVILYLLWPAAWLAWATCDGKKAKRPEFLQLLLMIIISITFINFGYLCEETGQPLSSFRSGRTVLGRIQAISQRYSLPIPVQLKDWVAAIPVPLPGNYVRGIDEIGSLYEFAQRQSYLRGEWNYGGWWYYYIYGLMVKEPLGIWLNFVLACAMISTRKVWPRARRDEFFLLIPIIEVVSFATCATSVHQHVRYVLPVLPFVFIFSSKVFLTVGSRLRLIVASAALGCSIVSSLAVYPHSLSYFNELAGGPMRGHEHLLDSNIAWGQDHLFLKQWFNDHPEAKPIFLASTSVDALSFVEGDYLLPPDQGGAPFADGTQLKPGWYAISVHCLHMAGYEYFLERRPIAMAGYSIYIYHIKDTGIAGASTRPRGERPMENQ